MKNNTQTCFKTLFLMIVIMNEIVLFVYGQVGTPPSAHVKFSKVSSIDEQQT